MIGREDKTDDIRFAGSQTDARTVGNVADLVGNLSNALFGFLTDVGRITQRAGDGLDGQAAELGNGFEGREPASIRMIVVLPQPDGPRRAKNSRSKMSRLRLSIAVKLPNRLVTFLN